MNKIDLGNKDKNNFLKNILIDWITHKKTQFSNKGTKENNTFSNIP